MFSEGAGDASSAQEVFARHLSAERRVMSDCMLSVPQTSECGGLRFVLNPALGLLLLIAGLLTVPLTSTPASAYANAASYTWTAQTPAASPSGRFGASMAYDSATGDVVLFGGQDSGSGYLNDTWTWNGTTWNEQSPAASPPLAATERWLTTLIPGTWCSLGATAFGSGYLERHVDVGRHHLDGSSRPITVSPEPLCRSDGLRPSHREHGALRRLRRHRWSFERHLDVGRHHLDRTIPGSIASCLGRAVDGLRLGDREHGALRRIRRQYVPERHLDLGRHHLDPAIAHDVAVTRYIESMAYDPATADVVLFGGSVGPQQDDVVNDTWTWDGTPGRSSRPPRRLRLVLARPWSTTLRPGT